MSARGMAPLGPMPVLLRRNDSCSIFDEDAAFRFRELIRQRKKAVIRCQGQCSEIVPVAVRVDKRLGRWYLLYWDGKPRMARLSNLTYVRDGARAPDWKGYARQVNEFFACSGVSAFRDEGSPYRVKVKVKLEGAMLLRFSRDIRLGQMEAGDTGRIYCVRINDPGELVPLLRQYAPGLEIQPGPDRLRQRIREDLLQMRSQLEEDL